MKKIAVVVAGMLPALALGLGAQQGAPAFTKTPLAQRISHTNPANFRPSPRVHGGPGQLDYMALFTGASGFDTNVWFLHRGIIEPKAGIGGHFHNNCEEMFVILDGEAQFTVDGRTSTLKGPAGAPTRMGHWHAIYNNTDKPVQWMNINVTQFKNQYDAFNLDDGRENAPIDAVPQFMTMRLDRTLLRAVPAMYGGKGDVQYRRALDRSVFVGPWGFVDHYLLPAGASIGASSDAEIGGFYYVLAGKGKVTIGTETADIAVGDAIPLLLNDSKSFENAGTEPLELMQVGVVSNMSRRNELLAPIFNPVRGGGPGVPGAPAGGPGRGGRGQ
ncbi:MAG: cupin domain-containing protein [Acidobacteriota bacterium]